MKTLKMSDEDYKDLMDLAKELRTQDHDSQANPRMWTVDTTHERVCKDGYRNYDGTQNGYSVVSSQSGTSIRLEELWDKLLNSYNTYGLLDNLDEEYEDYIGSVSQFVEWCDEEDITILDVLNGVSVYNLSDYLETLDDIDVVPIEEYEKHELNATFFKADAKKHIEINGHNLNKNPHTYGFSVYRMPKMERLFNILEKIGEEE